MPQLNGSPNNGSRRGRGAPTKLRFINFWTEEYTYESFFLGFPLLSVWINIRRIKQGVGIPGIVLGWRQCNAFLGEHFLWFFRNFSEHNGFVTSHVYFFAYIPDWLWYYLRSWNFSDSKAILFRTVMAPGSSGGKRRFIFSYISEGKIVGVKDWGRDGVEIRGFGI